MPRPRSYIYRPSYWWLIPTGIAIASLIWLIVVQVNQDEHTVKLIGLMDNNTTQDQRLDDIEGQIEMLAIDVDQVNSTVISSNSEFQDEINMLKTQVLELQICKNNTAAANAGAIVTGTTNPMVSIPIGLDEFFVYQDPPIWDDAGYWNASEPNGFRVPQSGRYAAGLNVWSVRVTFTPATPMAQFTLDFTTGIVIRDESGSFVPSPSQFNCKNKELQSNDDILGGAFFTHSANYYCEFELPADYYIRGSYAVGFSGDFEGNTASVTYTYATLSVRRIGDLIV